MMKIVVTGASGNLGTAVLAGLRQRYPDAQLVGISRRRPPTRAPYDGVAWVATDVAAPGATAGLREVFSGAHAVIHLAWVIQPVRDEAHLRRVNVGGSAAVLDAVAAAGVPHLVYASSLGVYAPGAREPVEEQWPATGVATSVYSRDKVVVERAVDAFEHRSPDTAVTRIRPTLVVQRDAAREIARYFLGPLVPPLALRVLRAAVPVLPLPRGLRIQFVHAEDVADAICRILDRRACGAFNLAPEAMGTRELAALFRARPLPVPAGVARVVVDALHRLRMLPVSAGWFDLATEAPLLDSSRAAAELDWRPGRTSAQAARELVEGLIDGAHGASPALGS